MLIDSEKLIILDRDGVINEDLFGYVTSKDEFKPIKGSLEAIANLTQAGFLIAIATNQACINKEIINEAKLNEVHNYMMGLVEEKGGKINFIAFCPHLPEENCDCRKPEVGLLNKIEKQFECSLRGSFFIGDKESDILCAEKFGCIPILVQTGYGAKTFNSNSYSPETKCFKNLFLAVNYILSL